MFARKIRALQNPGNAFFGRGRDRQAVPPKIRDIEVVCFGERVFVALAVDAKQRQSSGVRGRRCRTPLCEAVIECLSSRGDRCKVAIGEKDIDRERDVCGLGRKTKTRDGVPEDTDEVVTR